MPRYYFHLLNDIDAPDEEGVELPDLEAALKYARRNARSGRQWGRIDPHILALA